MSSPTQNFAAVFIATVVIATPAAGCVAMNIPSQRLHDPADHGGILGSWSGHPVDSCDRDSSCIDGGLLDELDGGALPIHVDHNGLPVVQKPDPVPWPRYHPIPTRPAFSPPPGAAGPY